MNLQTIFNIATIAARQNLRNMILSPGSRVAPLTLAFVRQADVHTITLSDERAAAYTAFGLAQALVHQAIDQNHQPLPLVGIACTSGTAAYNYAPAVAEAFFQEIPLIIFTADRPPEWIDQKDGQTIRQREIYGRHIKASYEFPVDYSHPDAIWHAQRMANEAFNLARTAPYGPVHLNFPFREPFYPSQEEKIQTRPKVQLVSTFPSQSILHKATWNDILDIWENTPRKLIVVGQGVFPPQLSKALQNLYNDYHIPILADTISNISSVSKSITHHDLFLPQISEDLSHQLRPDLLITFGKSVISKALKLFLRKFPPGQHWHIQLAGPVADTFQSLSQVIPVEPSYFFHQLFSDLDFQNLLQNDEEGEDNPYDQIWQQINAQAQQYAEKFSFPDYPLSELEAIKLIINYLPQNTILHLANSMPVRYVNYWGLPQASISVFANRGTSGIDGCLSTAVGCAMANPSTLVTILIGDLAFFYDRNALWNNYLPTNLRIILLNNHGGNIFRMIQGPKNQPEFAEYFETDQKLNAANTARDFDLEYLTAQDSSELIDKLSSFFDPATRSKILEITTDKEHNALVFNNFKSQFQV